MYNKQVKGGIAMMYSNFFKSLMIYAFLPDAVLML